MYNRYIPRSDGTYQRNRIPDVSNEPPHPTTPPRPEAPPRQPPPPPICEQPPNSRPCQGQPCPLMSPPAPKPNPQKRPLRPNDSGSDFGIGNFLRRLLPRDFDTEDLIVILLLLLMAGDCQEDQNSALLTLALYLFL